MKKLSITCLLALLLSQTIFAQSASKFNLDFEKVNETATHPLKWDMAFRAGRADGYIVKLDSKIVKSGKYAVTIYPDDKAKNATFGACDYVIPATYSGSKIELRGYLKTKNVSKDGHAGIWLRIDGDDGMLQFDNMRKQKITGTNDWKEYSVQLPLPEEATKIHVGALLIGKGQIWADNLRLFIDGKPIEKAPTRKLKTYPARVDTAFYGGSKISIAQLSSQQIANLSLLGKVWGFVKYYNHQIAKGKYNMDSELFRILPQVLASKSTNQRDQVLSKWINKFGKNPICKDCKTTFGKNVKQTPDIAWTKNKKLSPELRKQLAYLFKNRNQGKHYYIDMTRNVGNPVVKNEEAYNKLKYPDAGYRLLTLYRYWNIIQYFFPYKYAIDKDWNKVLDELVPEFVAAKDALAYHLVVQKMVANIEDSHGFLREKYGILRAHQGKYQAPVQVTFIKDKPVITNYYNQKLGKATGLQIGDVITAINGQSIKQIMKAKFPFIAASNRTIKLRNLSRFLLRSSKEKLSLKVKRGKKKLAFTIDLQPLMGINRRIDFSHSQPKNSYRLINKDVGYIHLGKIQKKEVDPAFKLFAKTKGLVIDIRNYPSDFPIFAISRHLYPESKPFVKFAVGHVNTPGLFTMGTPLSAGSKNKDYYQGKVVIIINEISQSSAEYHSMAFRNAPKAVVIGSTTAAADGNVSSFSLPGGFKTWITGIGVYYPDGTETQRVGIVPDVEVRPTIQGIKAGKDELLDKALEIIHKKSK